MLWHIFSFKPPQDTDAFLFSSMQNNNIFWKIEISKWIPCNVHRHTTNKTTTKKRKERKWQREIEVQQRIKYLVKNCKSLWNWKEDLTIRIQRLCDQRNPSYAFHVRNTKLWNELKIMKQNSFYWSHVVEKMTDTITHHTRI